ncbi:ATP-binding protein [Agaribacterium haliotis]|uniref:ATP-binding protein n=1 Tax=Agaribacterium haliotis TaxID=2013869 RepID=UPI0011787FFC|nr:ATP-binding protein [Agaribacterium haliotis]
MKLRSLIAAIQPAAIFFFFGLALPVIATITFLYHSAESERLASKKKLELLYQKELQVHVSEFSATWRDRLQSYQDQLDEQGKAAWLSIVADSEVVSAVLWNEKSQAIAPHPSHSNMAFQRKQLLWSSAQAQEFQQRNYRSALSLYQRISSHSKGIEALLAMLAEARCLIKLDQRDAAIKRYHSMLDFELDAQQSHNFGRDPRLDAVLRLSELDLLVADDEEKLVQLLSDEASLSSLGQRQLVFEGLLDRGYHFGQVLLQLKKADMFWRDYELSHNQQDMDFSSLSGSYINLSSDEGRFNIFLDKQHFSEQLSRNFSQQHGEFSGRLQIVDLASQLNNNSVAFELRVPSPFDAYVIQVHVDRHGSLIRSGSMGLSSFYVVGFALLFMLSASAIYVFVRMRRQEKLNELKNDMMATVSHELRTPLSSVRILIDNLIEEHEAKGDKLADYLRIISDENERLTRLVNNFLSFSRIDRGRYDIDSDYFSVNLMLNEVVNSLSLKLNQADVEFSFKPLEQDIDFYGDRDKLIVVVFNLLENAYKYSTKLKKIELLAERINSELVLSVTDNGCGLSKLDQEKVFEKFYRVEQQLSRSTEGCGLGLYISAYIVELHGGRIELSSQLGKGSCFRMLLPLMD